MAPKVVPAEIRFWRFVDKNGPVSELLGTNCWLWTGGKGRNAKGGGWYGRFRGPGSRMVASHRFSWEMVNGPTDAQAVDHRCRVTLCVNPDHLEPVSDRINILRGTAPTAINARKEVCRNGHPFNRTSPNGRHRYCQTCRDRKVCPAGHPHDAVDRRGRGYCTSCTSDLGKRSAEKRWGKHPQLAAADPDNSD